jgi:hypothetical protein
MYLTAAGFRAVNEWETRRMGNATHEKPGTRVLDVPVLCFPHNRGTSGQGFATIVGHEF